MHLATLGRHEALVSMLIKKGLDVNAKGHDGETALLQAANIGHVAIAQLLMKEGADVREEIRLVRRRYIGQQRMDARPSSSCCLSEAQSKPTQKMIPVEHRCHMLPREGTRPW